MFKKAVKNQAKVKITLTGPAGSGKSFSAQLIAKGMGGRVACIDTERGSASLYADRFDFDVMTMEPPFTPEKFIEAIHEAENAGYDILIIDSMTHEWSGQGGVLEIVENIAKSKYRGNSYAAWNEGTPRHQRFVDAVLNCKCHVITTMRSKTVYVETENAKGKVVPQKMGTAPQQREGLDYEFTVVFDLSIDGHLAVASKDRTGLFTDPFVVTEQTGKDLLEWLNSGKPIEKPQMQSAPKPPLSELRKDFLSFMAERHNSDKDKIYAELTSFFNREVQSSNDLSDDDISEFMSVVQADKEPQEAEEF